MFVYWFQFIRLLFITIIHENFVACCAIQIMENLKNELGMVPFSFHFLCCASSYELGSCVKLSHEEKLSCFYQVFTTLQDLKFKFLLLTVD